MRRVVLSILGGFFFPFCYAVIAMPLSVYIKDAEIRWILSVPLGWPRFLYFYLFVPFFGDPLANNQVALVLYVIVCDVLFYTVITYFVLSIRSALKPPPIAYVEPPPPP